LPVNIQFSNNCPEKIRSQSSQAFFRLLNSDFRLLLMVGLGGFEPPTSRLSGVRSNQLSYRPKAIALVHLGRMLVELIGLEPTTS
jgi:hypothetical protein